MGEYLTDLAAWQQANPLTLFKAANELTLDGLAVVLGCSPPYVQRLLKGGAYLSESQLATLAAESETFKLEYEKWRSLRPARP